MLRYSRATQNGKIQIVDPGGDLLESPSEYQNGEQQHHFALLKKYQL
jgi:hypothetical protein